MKGSSSHHLNIVDLSGVVKVHIECSLYGGYTEAMEKYFDIRMYVGVRASFMRSYCLLPSSIPCVCACAWSE